MKTVMFIAILMAAPSVSTTCGGYPWSEIEETVTCGGLSPIWPATCRGYPSFGDQVDSVWSLCLPEIEEIVTCGGLSPVWPATCGGYPLFEGIETKNSDELQLTEGSTLECWFQRLSQGDVWSRSSGDLQPEDNRNSDLLTVSDGCLTTIWGRIKTRFK